MSGRKARNPRSANGSRRRKAVARLKAQGLPCWVCGLPIDGGLPAGDPLAFECDEIVPVSKGGSPYDPQNLASAHRCCNNWRRDRPASFVEQARALVASRHGAWRDPLEFVARAKAVERGASRAPLAAPRATTDW